MQRRAWLVGMSLALLCAAPAKAQNGVIVRTTLGASGLQVLCQAQNCTVVGALDGTLNQVFLLTTPLDPQTLVTTLILLPGIVNAEVDQVLSLIGAANLVPSPIPTTLMSDRTLVPYPANSGTMAWNSYVTQPAAGVVEVQNAQSQFHVTGTGIVTDIDTGVDPNHPALQGVLLPGYDFTRNQTGGSEMTDLPPTFTQPTPCDSTTCPSPVQVNQESAAILDQESAAILDTNAQYAAFGHGTMVMGVIHLVAPTAQLLPLKAFKSDGTANLSNILRAIYYGVQNNANVINMSFDTKTASTELKNALDYANQLGVVSVASAGNDGMQETVYPAALQNDVMGVASVGSTTATDGTRSTFSNFGNAIVWVAAPGEGIVTTYPFSTYAAGWGTSFSAPFVSGASALARSLKTAITQSAAAAAIAQAAPLSDPGMGHGRLDLVLALQLPLVSLSRTSVAFGNQELGNTSTPQSVMLTNTGTFAVNISSIAIAGANDNDFSIAHNCPLSPNTIASGAGCVIQPTFKPTSLGPRKTLISINDSASGSPHGVILTGVGTAVSLSPANLNFGNQNVGTSSAPQSITILNKSSAALNLWQIAILGPNAGDFSKTSTCGSTLGAAANCTVSVTFNPTAAGTRSALALFSDDGGGSPQAISLAGAGVAVAASPSPSTSSSGNQVIATTNSTTTPVLSNTGSAGAGVAATASPSPSTSSSGNQVIATTNSTTTAVLSNTGSAGAGVAATVSSSPSTSSSGNQVIGTSNSTNTAVLSSTGNATLNIGKIPTKRPSLRDFVETNTHGSRLAAEQSLISPAARPRRRSQAASRSFQERRARRLQRQGTTSALP